MNYNKVLRKSWDVIWQSKVLWFFGTLLALTAVSVPWWLSLPGPQEYQRDIQVRITDEDIIYLPGEGLSIDFTDPDGVTIRIEDGVTYKDIETFEQFVYEFVSPEVWNIIVFGLVWLFVLILITVILRYTSETALIGMVNEKEEKDSRVGFLRGLRIGWSRLAWRIFLLDLIVFLLSSILIIIIIGVVAAPLFLLTTGSSVSKVLGIMTSSGLFFLFLFLGLIGVAGISIFVQLIRRVCIQDNVGIFAGIRQGIATFFKNPGEWLVVWLVWIGVSILWSLVAIPVFIVLTPVLLFFILIGTLITIPVVLLTAGISSLFIGGYLPWVVGGIIAFPIFLLIMLIPLAFVNGLVRIYRTNLWTLSYRELRLMKNATSESSPPKPADKRLVKEVEATGLG